MVTASNLGVSHNVGMASTYCITELKLYPMTSQIMNITNGLPYTHQCVENVQIANVNKLY